MKKQVKILCFAFIILFGTFFVNVDMAKAIDGDGSGYAKCYYRYICKTAASGETQIQDKYYYAAVIFNKVKKNDGGYEYRSWGAIACGEEIEAKLTESKTGVCNILDYDKIFHKADSYKSKFNSGTDDNPNWKCPAKINIDAKTGGIFGFGSDCYNDVKITYDENGNAPLIDSEISSSGIPNEDTSRIEGQYGGVGMVSSNSAVNAHNGQDGSTPADNDISKIIAGEDIVTPEGRTDCSVIPGDLKDLIQTILWIISVIAVILLLIMTMISFIKVVTGAEDGKLNEAFKHLLIRVAIVVIILLLPLLFGFIINIINTNFGGTYTIGDDGNPFCQY